MTTRELLENYTREEGIALFNTKKTDKEVYNMFVSKGLTDSYETFTAEAQKVFSEKVSKMSTDEILALIEGAELSEKQLEQIAGGKGDLSEEAKCGIILGGCAAAAATALAL